MVSQWTIKERNEDHQRHWDQLGKGERERRGERGRRERGGGGERGERRGVRMR